jgi:hypothetical protein
MAQFGWTKKQALALTSAEYNDLKLFDLVYGFADKRVDNFCAHMCGMFSSAFGGTASPQDFIAPRKMAKSPQAQVDHLYQHFKALAKKKATPPG